LLILLPLPLGALSGFFAYYHYILGVGSAAAGYWSLGGLMLSGIWAMRLIDLAKKDISFEPSDWAWEPHAAGWRGAALGASAGSATMALADAFWHHDDNPGDLGDDADHSLHMDAFASESLSDDGFSSISSWSDDDGFEFSNSCINPATGLPMIGDSCGGVDVMGNPYGDDLSDSFSSSWSDDSFSSMTWSSDDSWSSSTSSWD
jgi:hypothetical protein